MFIDNYFVPCLGQVALSNATGKEIFQFPTKTKVLMLNLQFSLMARYF